MKRITKQFELFLKYRAQSGVYALLLVAQSFVALGAARAGATPDQVFTGITAFIAMFPTYQRMTRLQEIADALDHVKETQHVNPTRPLPR